MHRHDTQQSDHSQTEHALQYTAVPAVSQEGEEVAQHNSPPREHRPPPARGLAKNQQREVGSPTPHTQRPTEVILWTVGCDLTTSARSCSHVPTTRHSANNVMRRRDGDSASRRPVGWQGQQ